MLVPVEAPRIHVNRVTDENGRPLAGLLVEGERTGHAHRLPGRIYDTDAGRLILLGRPTTMTHEEHADVEVPAGWWRPIQQQEYVPATRPATRRRAFAD